MIRKMRAIVLLAAALTPALLRAQAPAGQRDQEITSFLDSTLVVSLDTSAAFGLSGRYVNAQGIVRQIDVAGDRLLVSTGGGTPVRYGR